VRRHRPEAGIEEVGVETASTAADYNRPDNDASNAMTSSTNSPSDTSPASHRTRL
jgi:hypothetical protein